MVQNSSNTLDNSLEKDGKKLTKEDLKAKLIFDYIKSKLKSKEAIQFLNNATQNLDIPEEMKNELKNQYLKMPTYSSLTESDVDSLIYVDILPEISSEIIDIRFKRQKIKNLILKDYDITSSLFDSKFGKRIDSMSQQELDDHVNVGEQERTALVREIFGKKIPAKRNMLKFLSDFNLESRRKKLTLEKKQQLDTAFEIIRQDGGKLDYVGLEELFEVGIFSNDEKKKLVTTFIPSINLARGVELGVFSIDEAEKIKKSYIEDGLGTLGIDKNMSNSKRKQLELELLKKLHNQDLDIDTNNINNFNEALGKFIEGGELEKIVDSYNNVIDSAGKTTEEIKNHDDFLEVLGSYIYPLEVAKFQIGSTVVLRQKRQGGEEEIFYFDIANNGKNNGNIILQPRGYNCYDKNDTSCIQKENYVSFLSVVSGDAKANTAIETLGVEILDKTDLKQKLDSGSIENVQDTLDFVNDDEIQLEKERLEKELYARQHELRYNGMSDHEIEDDERINDLERKQFDLLNTEENLEAENLQTLIRGINNFDEEGKNKGFTEGTTFTTKKGDSFTIKQVNEASKEILIWSPAAPGKTETLSYTDFYAAFREHNAKRTSNVTNFNSLFENISGDSEVGKKWSEFEFKNDSIEKKGMSNSPDYDFLVGEKGDNSDLLKIDKISGDTVYVNFGEVKEKTVDAGGDKKEIQEIFNTEKKSVAVTMGWLENYIKEHKLVPRSIKEKNVQEDDGNNGKDIRSGSFLSRIFNNNLSVFEVIAGSKLFMENIQSFLKEGTDEKAAQFALDFYGNILPDEIRSDLVARVETAQKKRMDDYVTKLKSVNSGPATEMIRKWLENKDIAPYKLEAGVLFMMENYGELYSKNLQDLPRFTWYEALGGEVGDELYKKEEKASEEADTTFSEESLILTLLGKQCKGGYNGITRRSRIEKEYKAMRGKGKEEEIAKGEKDANVFRRVEDRIEGGVGELGGKNDPNAIGWIKATMDKGGSYEQMNKIPFMMLFSDRCYDYDNIIVPDALKNFNAKGYILPITRFMSYKTDMELMNKTILAVTQRLQNLGRSGLENIHNDALAVKRTPKIPHEGKMKATEKFYDTYGEVLTDILYKVNNSNSGKYGDLSKLIFLEKDKGIGIDGKMQQGNSDFLKYYDHFNDLIGDAEFGNEDLMDDALDGVGVTGVDIKKATASNLDFKSGGGWVKKKSGPKVWKEIKKQFSATANQAHNGLELLSVENIDIQRRITKDNLRGFISGILKIAGTNEGTLKNYEESDFSVLIDWGIRASKDLKRSGEEGASTIGSDEVSDGTNAYFEAKLDVWVQKIIDVEQGGNGNIIGENNDLGERPSSIFDQVGPDTQEKASKVLNDQEH